MDKYEQFKIEQASLLKALAESGPTETLRQRMAVLYQNACCVVVLGPSTAQQAHPEEGGAPADEEEATAFDVQAYIRAIEGGALADVFEMKAWGDAVLEYQATELDGRICPGVRVAWSDKIAFLAEGKDKVLNGKLEAMASACAEILSAKWYRWEVRLV